MNKRNRLLRYSDVVLVPQKSKVESRSHVDVSCKLGEHMFNLPVVPANMKTVMDASLAKELSDNAYFYVMHRFGIDNYKFVKTANEQGWRVVSISVCVKPSDVKTLKRIAKDNLQLDYVTIDIAHGHSVLMENTLKEIKDIFGEKTFVIAGNVATGPAVHELTEWGADAIKVGIGQGSPCTTKDKTGFTKPMFSCLL